MIDGRCFGLSIQYLIKNFQAFHFCCNFFLADGRSQAGHISLLGQFYLFSVIFSLNSLDFITFPMKVYLDLFTLQSS